MANFEYNLDSDVTTVRRRGKTRLLFLIMILLVITSAVGAYFVGYHVKINNSYPAEDNTQEFHRKYQDSVDNKKLEDNLRYVYVCTLGLKIKLFTVSHFCKRIKQILLTNNYGTPVYFLKSNHI